MKTKAEITDDDRAVAAAWMRTLGLGGPLWGDDDLERFAQSVADERVAAEKTVTKNNEKTADEKAFDAIAKHHHLDEVLARNPSAEGAIAKLKRGLEYVLPGSGRFLNYVVIERGHAQCLLDDISKPNLTFFAYTAQALESAFYPEHGINALLYLAAKLGSESGELTGKVCKAIRDCNGAVDEARRQALLDEAGDCLWYLNSIASELNSSLAEVATKNLAKIAGRRARGTLNGDGDNR